MALNSSISGRDSASTFALFTIPTAIGCSEFCSKAAASLRISMSEIVSVKDPMRLTPKLPSVSVPVLSNKIAVILREFSNAVRFRIRRPFWADIEVEMETTNGIARPSACGQDITITVTIRSRANTKSNPRINHTASVVNPTVRAT